MHMSLLKIVMVTLVFTAVPCFTTPLLNAQDQNSDDAALVQKRLIESIRKSLSELEKLDGKDSQIDDSAKLALYSAVRKLVAPRMRASKLLRNYELRGGLRTDWFGREQDPSTIIATNAVEYIYRLQSNVMKPSPYWIGIQCDSAEKYEIQVSDSHVVTAEGGLIINAVTPDSPAESAGIETGDVIVFLNEKPTNNIMQLVSAVDECKDNEVKVVVVRAQEMVTFEITPSLRENEDKSDKDEDSNDPEQANTLIELAIPNQTIPENFEAVVRFKLGEPLTITLKYEDEQWKVDSVEAIEQLPEDVQPFAAHVFKTNSPWVSTNQNFTWTPGNYRDGVYEIVPQSWSPSQKLRLQLIDPASKSTETTESKLDQIQDQIEQLSEAITELRKRD